MRNIFIIHGSYGHSKENWFPWLKTELEKLGNKVFVPDFPTPKNKEGHSLDLWLKKFDKYKKHINSKTIFIAHSRGCNFVIQLLPRLNLKIDSLFFVGPFFDYDQWRPTFYKDYDSFQAEPYLWKYVRKLTNYIEIFQSTNDVITLSEGQFVADKLNAKINIIKNAGHFNSATDKKFKKFPLLLNNIKKYL